MDNVDCIAEVVGYIFVVESLADCCFSVVAVLAKDLEKKKQTNKQTNKK